MLADALVPGGSGACRTALWCVSSCPGRSSCIGWGTSPAKVGAGQCGAATLWWSVSMPHAVYIPQSMRCMAPCNPPCGGEFNAEVSGYSHRLPVLLLPTCGGGGGGTSGVGCLGTEDAVGSGWHIGGHTGAGSDSLNGANVG
eukprot:6466524-Amphidinium_carterae.2